MTIPEVSVIIGSFNRPGRARTFLACLVDQDFTDWEAVLTDNSDDPECRRKIEELCKIDPRIRYEWTHDRAFTNFPRVGIPSLYDAAEIGVNMTTGKYLWFPNDDTYACPWFLKRMIQTAEDDNLDLVICDFVQGRQDMRYHFFESVPRGGMVDKTNFIMTREWFPEEWPEKITTYGMADGVLINTLIARNIRWGKFPELLIVHN